MRVRLSSENSKFDFVANRKMAVIVSTLQGRRSRCKKQTVNIYRKRKMIVKRISHILNGSKKKVSNVHRSKNNSGDSKTQFFISYRRHEAITVICSCAQNSKLDFVACCNTVVILLPLKVQAKFA